MNRGLVLHPATLLHNSLQCSSLLERNRKQASQIVGRGPDSVSQRTVLDSLIKADKQ